MKKKRLICILAGLLIELLCVDCFAQNFSLRHVTVNDGLPSNETFCVYPKTFGVLYIGTEYGLVEYDGDEFKSVPFENKRYNGAMVFEIKPDTKNKLWVKTYRDGLFYLENDTLRAFSNNKELIQLTHAKDIGQMVFDSASNLWLTFPLYSDTVFYVNTITGNIKKVALAKQGRLKEASYLFHKVSYLNELIVPVRSNASTKNKPFEIINDYNSKGIFLNNTFVKSSAIRPNTFVFNANDLFLGMGPTLFHWDYNTKKLITQKVDAEIIYLYQDKRKNILIGTRKGAYHFNTKTRQLSMLFNDYLVTGIMQDNESGYWFTTNNGLVYMPSTDIHLMQSLTEKAFNISTISGFKNKFAYIGNSSNIYVYDCAVKGKEPKFLFEHKAESAIPKKMLWLSGTELLYYKAVLDVNTRTEKWLMSIKTGEILDIEKGESDSVLLFAFKRGFSRVNRFAYSKNNIPPLYSDDLFCRAIYEKNGQIYIGTDQGMFMYSNNRTLTPLHHDKINFQISDIKSISNNIIVTTRGGGVFVLNKNNVNQISLNEGLSSTFTTRIFVQNDSVFWVGSNKGLNKITAKEATFKVAKWFVEDGLVSDKITDLTAAGENLFVLTDQGINYFKYNELVSRDPKITIGLLHLKINKAERSTSSNTLQLKPGDRDISFEFKIRGWQKRKNQQVRYILTGLKQVQSQTGGQTISYTDLEPGDYTLEVQVMGLTNNKIGLPLFYYISIEPYFYQTLTFKVSLILILVLGLILSLFWYIRDKERKRKKKWEYSNAQLEALNLQINPHFLFNALNSIQYLSFNKEHALLNTFIANLSELLRSILKHAKLNLISLSVELENVEKYLQLETLRFEKDEFHYTITIDEKLNLKRNFIPPMIIQPIVENALWHGLLPYKGDKFLDIDLRAVNGGFEIIILDKGIGVEQSKKIKILHESTVLKTSLGLENVQRRMELFESMGYGKASFVLEDLSQTNHKIHGTKAVFTFQLNTIEIR